MAKITGVVEKETIAFKIFSRNHDTASQKYMISNPDSRVCPLSQAGILFFYCIKQNA